MSAIGLSVARVGYPAQGTVRVGGVPERLPSPPRPEGDPGRFAVGPNQYDDPLGRFVRYTASSPRGSLVELMARFRPSPSAEEVLAAVEGVTDTEPYLADLIPIDSDDRSPATPRAGSGHWRSGWRGRGSWCCTSPTLEPSLMPRMANCSASSTSTQW